MKKTLSSALLLVLAAPAWGQGAAPPKPAPRLVRDAKWEPKPGDRAAVDRDDVPAAVNMAVWRQAGKLLKAGDATGLAPYYGAGSLLKLERGAEVLVILRHDYRPPPPPAVTLHGAESFHAYAQAMILDGPAPEPPPNLLEVRVLSGNYQGRALVVEEKDVARYVPDDTPAPAPKPPPKKADPKGVARSLLAAGRNLERAGKTAAAAGFYRRVVKEHGGAPEAKEAAARLKALGM